MNIFKIFREELSRKRNIKVNTQKDEVNESIVATDDKVKVNKKEEKNKIAAKKYRDRYNNDPEFRKKQLERSKKYQNKKYKEDPEFRQKSIDKAKEYNKKHKENKTQLKDDKNNNKICVNCGKPNPSKTSKFCSRKCYQQNYYQKHKDVLLPKRIKYNIAHGLTMSPEVRAKYDKEKEATKEQRQLERKERQRENWRRYYEKHKNEINKRHNERFKEKYSSDPEFREKVLQRCKNYYNKAKSKEVIEPIENVNNKKQTAVIMNSNTYNYITENNLFGLSLEVFLESGVYLLVRPDLDGRVLKDKEIIVR